MAKGHPIRPTPSLPRLRCLDAAVDAADVRAGETMSGTFRDLVSALDSDHWRNRSKRLEQADEPKARRGRRAKPAPPVEREAPVELLVPAEALERPAPIYEPAPPAVIPRPMSTPPVRNVAPPRPGTRNHRDGRGRVPPSDAQVAVIDIDNPYGVPAGATAALVQPPPGAKGLLNGSAPREWVSPERERIAVVAAVRDEAPGKMFARHQIDRSCFLSAREYERLCVQASPRLSSSAGALDRVMSAPNRGDFQALEHQRRAAEKLAAVDESLRGRCGEMGLGLLQDVLKRGMTIEAAAEVRGETNRQEIRFLGSLFRRCLKELSIVMGFANRRGGAPRSQEAHP